LALAQSCTSANFLRFDCITPISGARASLRRIIPGRRTDAGVSRNLKACVAARVDQRGQDGFQELSAALSI
jgi:hypothetical protein